MVALGTHVLLELWQVSPALLDDRARIRDALLQAAEQARCTVVSEAFHRFAPQGVSGVVVIAESHISIHTWPEYGCAAVDIFTCGEDSMPERAAEIIVQLLGAGGHQCRVLSRDLPETAS